MEELTHVIPVSSIPAGHTPTKIIGSKPFFAIYCIGTVGLLLILSFFWSHNIWIIVFGGALLALAALGMVKIKNRTQMEVYDDFVVIYLENDPENCQLFHWDEIIEWTLRPSKTTGDMLIVKLNDEKYVYMETLNSSAVVRCFNKKVPNLESRIKARNEMPNTPFRWPWKKK